MTSFEKITPEPTAFLILLLPLLLMNTFTTDDEAFSAAYDKSSSEPFL